MLTPSAHVILQLHRRQGRNLETRFASRIKWDGGGGILVYDAADNLADRVLLSAVEQLTIEALPAVSPGEFLSNPQLRTRTFRAHHPQDTIRASV
jgi:hypothetical protein